ncbi:MAG: HNH endonuclease [Actinomycetota bacterium]|nr:HNH endonuclease [Actinomycetota bacterium]
MCSPSLSSVGRLAEAVAAVRQDDLALLSAEELEWRMRRLRRLADQVEAVFAETTAAFEATESYKDVGARTAASWLRHNLRMSAGEARRRVRVGQQIKQLPRMHEAFLAGHIGLAHVDILVAAVDELGAEAVRAAEAELVQLARLNDPWDLREAIRTLKQSLDPDSVDEAAKQAMARRFFSITPVGDEYVAKGVLDAETGAMLAQVLDTMSKPQAGPDGDERSPGQRRVDAIGRLCRSVLDAGLPQDNGVRPHLTVVLSWEALVGRLGAHPAQLDGFGTISTSLVRQLACDAAVARVVSAPDGSPIELGRTARAPSAAQRRGARVRDSGRCRAPGCRSRLVQLHHLVHWADGGSTDLANMVSLCPRHHRNVHSGRLRIESHGGHFRFRAKDGRDLTDHRDTSDQLVTELAAKLLDVD